jgi:hypothetical protein
MHGSPYRLKTEFMIHAQGGTLSRITTMHSLADLTLQFNLCAGDLEYGEPILRALITTHREDAGEVVVVADACRPQSTPNLHAPSRFPPAEFASRVERLRTLCMSLQDAGLVDRVEWLEPDPVRLSALNAKYCGDATGFSHDHHGHAFSAYFLAWECARTRYVAHFDADVLLWQQPGFHWLPEAMSALETDQSLIAASPRIAPPNKDASMVRVDAPGSGWLPTWPLSPVDAGWRSPWFSTRCHVMDRDRLATFLPLCGQRNHHRAATINRLLSPFFELHTLTGADRSRLAQYVAMRLPCYPLPPEVLLHEHAQARGFACLYLDDPRAWYIHPETKSETFSRLLPSLLEAIGQHGAFPASQRGVSGLQFSAWESFLSCPEK